MRRDVGGDGFSDVHGNKLLLQIHLGMFWCVSVVMSVILLCLIASPPKSRIPKEVDDSLLGGVAHASIRILEVGDELVRIALEGQAFGLVHLSSR